MLRGISAFVIAMALAVSCAAYGGNQHMLKTGGRERTYLLHRPANLARANPVPLVLVLHGGTGDAAEAQESYHWDAVADDHGFVVVYPDGYRWSWTAGGVCCGLAQMRNVDDVAFLTQLVQTVVHDENIDNKRIYIAGMSNGAAMAYRLACEGTFDIAAIGSVSGSFSYACPKARAVSVMEIHGLDDHMIPFAGGHGTKAATEVDWLGVERTLAVFRAADDCRPPAIEQNGPVTTSTARCAAGRFVVLITIAGAGHQWPGGNPRHGLVATLFDLDSPSTALDATRTLWDFFAGHTAD